MDWYLIFQNVIIFDRSSNSSACEQFNVQFKYVSVICLQILLWLLGLYSDLRHQLFSTCSVCFFRQTFRKSVLSPLIYSIKWSFWLLIWSWFLRSSLQYSQSLSFTTPDSVEASASFCLGGVNDCSLSTVRIHSCFICLPTRDNSWFWWVFFVMMILYCICI